MTFAPFIDGTVPHHNKFSSRQGRSISRVNQHHWAGTAGGDTRLVDPDEDVSVNYIVYSDGKLKGQVPEEYRAWTSGSFDADAPAITIEVQNSSGQIYGDDSHPGSWQITQAARNTIIKLLAYLARKYNWGGVRDENYRGHREFASTACPGGFLWARMTETENAANTLYLKGSIPTLPTVPAPAPPRTPVILPKWAFNAPGPDRQRQIQDLLKKRGRYAGPIDGAWGKESIKGIQLTLRGVGYDGPIDGIPGANTCRLIQTYAAKFGDYDGPVDGLLGPNSWANFALGLYRP